MAHSCGKWKTLCSCRSTCQSTSEQLQHQLRSTAATGAWCNRGSEHNTYSCYRLAAGQTCWFVTWQVSMHDCLCNYILGGCYCFPVAQNLQGPVGSDSCTCNCHRGTFDECRHQQLVAQEGYCCLGRLSQSGTTLKQQIASNDRQQYCKLSSRCSSRQGFS